MNSGGRLVGSYRLKSLYFVKELPKSLYGEVCLEFVEKSGRERLYGNWTRYIILKRVLSLLWCTTDYVHTNLSISGDGRRLQRFPFW